MKIIDCEQGSPEWHEARCGRVSASRIADIVARTKSGPSASRATYLGEIIAERLTGRTAPSYTNAAMQWGNEQEPAARALYEMETSHEVVEIGTVIHPDIDWACASPDGLIKDTKGLVEIKCPNTATHINTLLGGAIDKRYITQMQWQMECTGYAWCDFVSFDPRLPTNMQLHIQRVERDNKLIGELIEEVRLFLIEVDARIEGLTNLYGKAA